MRAILCILEYLLGTIAFHWFYIWSKALIFGLSAGTGKLCIFGNLILVFIGSCFVSCLFFVVFVSLRNLCSGPHRRNPIFFRDDSNIRLSRLSSMAIGVADFPSVGKTGNRLFDATFEEPLQNQAASGFICSTFDLLPGAAGVIFSFGSRAHYL